jgi:hypothetical protein
MKKTVPQTVQGRQKQKMRIFSRYHRGSRYSRIDVGVPASSRIMMDGEKTVFGMFGYALEDSG